MGMRDHTGITKDSIGNTWMLDKRRNNDSEISHLGGVKNAGITDRNGTIREENKSAE